MNLAADCLLELGQAVDRGVFGLAAPDRRDRRLLDVVGRVEIGLAGGQADDVAAFGFERHRLVGNGNGGRGLDAIERVRNKAHGEVLESGAHVVAARRPARKRLPQHLRPLGRDRYRRGLPKRLIDHAIALCELDEVRPLVFR